MATPGVKFVADNLVKVVAPFIAANLVQFLLLKHYDVYISNFLCNFVALLVFPLTFAAKVNWSNYSDRRAAATLSATLAPEWAGRWPGSIDLFIPLVRKFREGYPGEGLPQVLEQYGSIFKLRLFWNDLYMTTEPEHIKALLVSQFSNFEKGNAFFDMMRSVLGSGVFNSDGELWKFHRSMARPFFSKERISDMELFGKHADKAIMLAKERLQSGYAVDVQDLFARFTMDTATEFLLGESSNSLSAGLQYPFNVPQHLLRQKDNVQEFSEAFSNAMFIIAERTRFPMWQLYDFFKDRTKEPMKIVDAFLYPIVHRELELKKENVKSASAATPDGETFLHHIVNLTEDPVLIKDEVLNVLLAARDTTASTLTSAIYLLAQHPNVLGRLRQEILTCVGPSRRPTLEDIKDMKYLRAVVNETLRLYPAVPFNLRYTVDGTTLAPVTPGGKPVYIPRGQRVSYSVLMMHRRKDLWGPDAEEFDPDRFLDHRLNKYLTPNPYIFLPFNAGPRICLGQQLSYNEASFMLIRFLQCFSDITMDMDAVPPGGKAPAEWVQEPGRQARELLNWKCHLTLFATGGVWARMHANDANDLKEVRQG